MKCVCREAYFDGLEVSWLPPAISLLPNLRHVSVVRCGSLKSLPPVWTRGDKAGHSSRLEMLRCSLVPLMSLPKSLCTSCCESLRVLELEHIPLGKLPPEISLLACLEVLSVRGVSWQDDLLPLHEEKHPPLLHIVKLIEMHHEPASDMKNEDNFYTKVMEESELFKVFDAACNGKKEIAEEFAGRSKFVTPLADQQIPDYCARLFGEIPRLGMGCPPGPIIDEDSCGFPLGICRLSNLRRLSLTFQCFRLVPSNLANLTHLEHLQLSHNPLLEALPSQLGLMKSLKSIKVRRCPSLKTPPPEVVSRGVESVVAYLKYLSSDQVCRLLPSCCFSSA